MQPTERRYLHVAVRGEQSQNKKTLSGIAARFNALSEDLGGFRERLAAGCFRESLASGSDIAMLFNHDSAMVLGRRSNGSLSLSENSQGLAFRCELNDAVSHARDAYAMCLRGDVKECSFGFTCDEDSWADEPDPEDRSHRGRTIPVRTVRRCMLHEISAVTFPAYANDATSVTASLADSPMAMSAAAGRSLFPAGAIPAEIRSRVPNIRLHPEDDELLTRARAFLMRCIATELKQ